MYQTPSLENKIALVTGASRGIGHAIALTLGQMGATVIGTATSEAGSDKISATFEQNSLKGFGLVLDVTSPDSIKAAIDKITKELGTPTILVNNAGITRDNLLMRMKDQEWEEIIQTNLTGVFRTSKACLRGMMKAKWGRIINISSVVGCTGNPGQANYAAAKAGLLGFSKSLAKEISSRGITVNVVAPGFIDTDMTRGLSEAQREALLQQIPVGGLGQAQDIANAVGFLASDHASYITGETMHVNGGMYMA